MQLPVSPDAVLEALQRAQSPDAALRGAGSGRLAELGGLAGYGACLLLVALSSGAVGDSVRLLAAIELKNAVGSLFAAANRSAASQASLHKDSSFSAALLTTQSRRLATFGAAMC